MKRLLVHEYSILSTVYEWPVEVDLSRNERTGLWTIYIRYTDSDHHPSYQNSGLTSGGIAVMLEEQNCDLEGFLSSLRSFNIQSLNELADEISAGSFEDPE